MHKFFQKSLPPPTLNRCLLMCCVLCTNVPFYWLQLVGDTIIRTSRDVGVLGQCVTSEPSESSDPDRRNTRKLVKIVYVTKLVDQVRLAIKVILYCSW